MRKAGGIVEKSTKMVYRCKLAQSTCAVGKKLQKGSQDTFLTIHLPHHKLSHPIW